MSKVEFHLVATLRGILHTSRPRVLRVQNHKGRRRVVEWRIVNAILQSFDDIQVSPNIII
jgi:hypothetical protein